MKSIRQRRMSVRQLLYASYFGSQRLKYFFRLARQWMKERGISCKALSVGFTYLADLAAC